MRTDQTLAGIVKSGLCSGCGACVPAVGPSVVAMRLNAKGFLRPHAERDLTDAEQARVRAVCPGLGLSHPVRFEEGTRYEPAWGPVRRVSAGHAVDPDVRHRGSSGGVLSALLIHLLASRQVDFVLHVQVAPGEPLRNEAMISRTRSEVLDGAGSRYSPASPVAALPVALALPGRFAFVGKPCDVAAVRKIISQEPSLAERIPILLSFMCAGTPSQHGTSAILKQMQLVSEDVVHFRYRGDGWPGLTQARTAAGRTEAMDYNTAWGNILNRHLQTRCKLCADGTGEFADVVCADAWYGRDGYPDFTERDGRSLVVARTVVGERLVAEAQRASVHLEPFDPGDLRAIQPYQHRRKSVLLARMLALRLLGGAVPSYQGLQLGQLAVRTSPVGLAKEFLGAARRFLGNRF
ncbi:Coenzyme F420 hydrogenase/dehydrogenase, beta subunit C-terminal domain [Pseudaquabacterium pictum]|uniref:Coenzyme F420 hydrogenase/dehydrogenase, beta subunit C-terminal domain n=1 Tax=Pseudaquabacterium pictum TaxID=2315236 RepID=UPI0010F7959E|nr:Coenzyme F420 hydrogenase/dehydrogenase, beta subunit C-terminal domain [Rubrivivax pictus]